MIKQIKTILVPVDFTENTEVAISKALEFCQEENDSTIHLFHVQRIVTNGLPRLYKSIFAGYTQQQVNLDMKRSFNRLQELAGKIKKEKQGINFICSVSFGDPVQESIGQKAKQLSADLIIIGKRSHHSFLTFLNTVTPNKLALITGKPVLTSKPGSLNQKIKTVVIPIGKQFPASKLDMIGALKNKLRPHVRLVVFEDDGSESTHSRHLLLETFRAFKSRFTHPIHYEVLDGTNKAKALLQYCNKVGADVLLVYSGVETRVGNWTNTHISDLIPASSKTQILAISQT